MSFVKTKQIVPFTQGASVTVASTAAETTLVSATGIGGVELLKNGFVVGKTYRVTAYGYYSNTSTPTLTLKFKFGSTVVASTGAVTTAASASNRVFKFEALVTVRSLGASGTVLGQCNLVDNASTITVTPVTAATTIDTTTNQVVNVTAQWGASSASNTITLTNLVLEELN